MRPTFQSLVILAACSLALWAEETLPLVNPGFEDGLKGWTMPKDEGMSSLSTEQAASGKHSLKVVDKDPKNGSNATASRVPIPGAGVYELRGKVFSVSSTGLGIYVRVLDKD
ncbi:MAG: heparinase, partial [Planctomycetes bacterium]|nr:heparinase [Planctomycetota bacterium]